MATTEPRHWWGDESSSIRGSLLRFALLSLGALCVSAAAVTAGATGFAQEEAVHDAAEQSRRMARLLAAPLVTEQLRAGGTSGEGPLGEVLRGRVRDSSVRNIILWDRDGRVIWAADESLVGRVYELPPVVADLFESGGVIADDTGDNKELDLGDARPLPGHRSDEHLVEVYVGARGADGLPFVFEAYFLPERVGFEPSSLLWKVLPISLLGLVVFQLLILPLAFSLARHVDRHREQRVELVARSLASWHRERRRLAQDLHDDVIQELAGAGLVVPAIERALPPGAEGERSRVHAGQVGAAITRSLGALRVITTDLFPADLDGGGLVTALEELTSRATQAGLVTRLHVMEDLALSPASAGVVFRVAREALRNVQHHAHATRATVRVISEGGMVLAEVTDDGVGLARPPGLRSGADGRRHLGLALMRATLRDVDGTLAVARRHGGGTIVQARIPLHIPG